MNGEEHGAWILLAGDERASARTRQIARRSGSIEIRTGAEHTFEELFAATTEILDSAPEGLVSAGIDMETNAVSIGVNKSLDGNPSREADARTQERRKNDVEAEVERGNSRRVKVELQMEAPRIQEAVTGGRTVTGNVPGALCTSGFTVKWEENGVGRRGVLTAGHCWYLNNLTGNLIGGQQAGWTLQQQGNVMGQSDTTVIWNPVADVALMDIPGTQSKVKHKFWNGKKMKNVGGVFLAAKGSFVCHHGKGTQLSWGYANTCGSVVRVNVGYGGTPNFQIGNEFFYACNYAACGPYFTQVSGPSLMSCAGDSGGPWYKPATPPLAVGVHTASNFQCAGFNPDRVADFLPILDAIHALRAVTNNDTIRLCVNGGATDDQCG